MRFRCPICKAAVEREAKAFPFCSERCQVLDLASWSDGSYAIPAEPAMQIESSAEESEERLH